MDELISRVNPMIKELMLTQEQYLESLELEISNIIRNSITNPDVIDCVLEQLLNLIQTDSVYYLYQKLCRYYYFIDKTRTLEYVKLYFDLYPEEKPKKKIKNK